MSRLRHMLLAAIGPLVAAGLIWAYIWFVDLKSVNQ